MSNKSWEDLNIISLIIVSVFGLWGGILNFLHRIKTHPTYSIKRKVFYFIIDIMSFTSITVIIYLGLIGYGLNELLSVAIAGFIGHQGANGIVFMEMILAEKIGADKTLSVVEKELKEDDKH